jgi:hypothetical protein
MLLSLLKRGPSTTVDENYSMLRFSQIDSALQAMLSTKRHQFRTQPMLAFESFVAARSRQRDVGALGDLPLK